MKKLLIATTNPGKFIELSSLLRHLPIKLLNLKDLQIVKKIDETGKSFTENAILKAKFYQQLSNLPTLADDGGLEIDVLNGEPGIHSHRWVHKDQDSTDEELINYTMIRLKDIVPDQRGAQLRVVLAIAIDQQHIFTSEAKVRGIIPLKISQNRMPGYPYRSLLFIPQIKKFYNEFELTEGENKQYNHRRKAIGKLVPIIRKMLLI